MLEVIEQENNVTLTPEDFDFINPTPATPPEGSGATYNTVVTVKANNVAAPFAGEIDIYYNRLDLADLNSMVELYIRSPETATTHDILPSLNRRFGLNLTQADIVLKNNTDMSGYKVANLEAEPTSLGWIGSIDVSVAEGDLLLEDYLLTTALPGVNYPTPYPTKPFAQFYSYWRDFSAEYDYLSTVQAGDPISLELTSAIGNVTGDPWQATGQAEFSLADSVISYAGPTADNGVANDDYEQVIVIDLDVSSCTGMTGQLVVHFSQPDDPQAAP